MEILKKFFPEVMLDNEILYFMHLEGVIESVDEYSSLQVTKNSNAYHFRLAPSHPKYTEMLLQEILKFHNLLQLRLVLSKSIKTSGTISFEITL